MGRMRLITHTDQYKTCTEYCSLTSMEKNHEAFDVPNLTANALIIIVVIIIVMTEGHEHVAEATVNKARFISPHGDL